MRKILITGANGLLGQKLLAQLSIAPDIDVVATGRGTNRNPDGNYLYEKMDATIEENIKNTLSLHQPNVVIHTAAMTQVDQCENEKEECWKQNVTAVALLASYCKQHNIFLVHLSTDFIFDGENGPYHEEDKPNPVSYYGESKLAAEKAITDSGARAAILRTMLVYGIAHDMSRSNIILWVKNNLENNKHIKVVNDQWRMPTLAEDLAKGCVLAAEKEAEGVFNISGKDMLTPYNMAIATAKFFSLDSSLIEEVDGSIFTQTAKRPPKTGFDLTKSRKVLGYEPVTFEEGLATLAEQIQKQ
ncbi:MAG: dTDP-4-dehydrorhamnose reductase [Cyclobacteriaceae bacterium]|jgi:dTDP-4-dehydrorhamnose reductase